jgi:hypothetical protein
MGKNRHEFLKMPDMKRILYTSIILIPCVFFCACIDSNSQSKNSEEDNGVNSTSWHTRFFCVIDGTAVKGNEMDVLQLSNTAFHYMDNEKKGKFLLFNLTSDKKEGDYYSMRFYMPEKTGSLKLTDQTADDCGCYVRLDFNLGRSDNFAIYKVKEVHVILDKITATGISGTFSGIFQLSDDSQRKAYKREIEVSQGKFEIPFSTGAFRPI